MTAAELLETALIESHRRGITDCQILILLALARRARPLRICELSSEVRRHRQTVLRAAECFTEDEVAIDRPSKVESNVRLRQPGVELLCKILKTSRAS